MGLKNPAQKNNVGLLYLGNYCNDFSSLALAISIRARGDRAELAAEQDILVDGVDEAVAP